MLREARPTPPRYDAARDTLELDAALGDGLPARLPGRATVGLLLDAGGALVGVDARALWPGAPALLLGEHEDVARVDEVEVGLEVRTPGTLTFVLARARDHVAVPR